ncbi:hypothetical protein JCM4914_11860 [Streptomyces platensis subsp. malvinus]
MIDEGHAPILPVFTPDQGTGNPYGDQLKAPETFRPHPVTFREGRPFRWKVLRRLSYRRGPPPYGDHLPLR